MSYKHLILTILTFLGLTSSSSASPRSLFPFDRARIQEHFWQENRFPKNHLPTSGV